MSLQHREKIKKSKKNYILFSDELASNSRVRISVCASFNKLENSGFTRSALQ